MIPPRAKWFLGGLEKLPTSFAWLGWAYSNLYLILHQSRRLESRKIPYSRKITNMTYLWSEITDMVWDRLKPTLRSEDKEFSNILDELKSNFRPPKALQPIERVEPDSYDKLLKELIFDRKAVATERALDFMPKQKQKRSALVGGLEHGFIFHFIYGMSSFPLTNSYFSRWLKPPTRRDQPHFQTSLPRLMSGNLFRGWYVTSPVFL